MVDSQRGSDDGEETKQIPAKGRERNARSAPQQTVDSDSEGRGGTIASDRAQQSAESRRASAKKKAVTIPDYETLEAVLEQMPKTWVGALLGNLVERAVREPFFASDAVLEKFVRNHIQRVRLSP